MKIALNSLRIIGLLEGVSYLVLLGIAMPLKYYFNQPQMVKIVGMAHGVLFVGYVFVLLIVHVLYKWSIVKTTGAFIASLVPLGTFYADKKWFQNASSI
jgi:integral membrane protein